MSVITEHHTRRQGQAENDIDPVMPANRAPLADRHPVAATSAHPRHTPSFDDLLQLESSPPRPSLFTVVVLFLSLAVTQVGVMAIVVSTFDFTTIRLALIFVVLAPAMLYGIIAAWDRQQLVASGVDDAAPWAWALAFPPVYLILRWTHVNSGSYGPVRAVLAWTLVQLAVTASLIALVAVGVVATPSGAADAAVGDAISPSQAAKLLTAPGIEEEIEALWVENGASGTAQCPDVTDTTPGATITCRGMYEGAPIEFSILIVDAASGERPWEVASWTTAP